MDAAALQRALDAAEARPLLLDSRLLRRVIKRHRRLPGFGLAVPHARCYALPRADLFDILSKEELGRSAEDLPSEVILLPRPDPRDLAGVPDERVLVDAWRYTFHARVHLEIERRARGGALTPARLRGRIHRIGQTELDEIRRVLRQDDLLLAPHGDLETYAELAALYLELQSFAPELIADVFPALEDRGGIDATLAEDVDVAELLAATRPGGAPEAPLLPEPPAPPIAEEPAPLAEDRAPATRRDEADDARRRGNVVRSAIARLGIAAAGGPDAADAEREARADLRALATRLEAALTPSEAAPRPTALPAFDRAGWEALLLALAERAAGRGIFRWIEARLLFDLQRACLASERATGKADLVDWALSFGKRPIARLLPATRPIRVARELSAAARKVPRVGLDPRAKHRLAALLAQARHRADAVIRGALRPAVEETLHEVGLRPESLPERVAREKLVEELLDQATARGHLGIGPLRDALSRNQLKLADLSSAGELFGGDPLLLADRRLSRALDGVHRRGEIYLRFLQKLSSLLFGTRPGRFLTRWLILPTGAAYVLLEGLGHMASPLGHALGLLHEHRHVHLLTPISFAATSLVLFGLIHFAALRAGAMAVLRGIGVGLAAVFFHAPRWLLTRPIIMAVLQSRAAFALRRYLLKPGAIAAAAVALTPLRKGPLLPEIVAASGMFVLTNLALNSRTGALAEEILLDSLARTLRVLRRHVLPGLFRLVADFFRRLTDAIDQGIYAVDEWLRFREGQSRAVLGAKAALGLLWFALAYVVRIYINLLIEPQVNPIKHFPVVTVAAKIMLPLSPTLIPLLHDALARVFGGFVAGTLAAPTVLLLPGVAGFLVWEFKENYKLYRATRATELTPAPIGHHGETMGALLKPGLHSGTVPKLWSKLRRAAKKGDGSAEKHEEAMREIAESIERFVDREMLDLLGACPRWTGGRLRVARVEIASNRVRVGITHGESAAAVIAFEEQSGWLLASVPRPGFLEGLGAGDRLLFENALAGLYQLAGVDMVREQIVASLPGSPPYDISEEGIVVWPDGAYRTEIVYSLLGRAGLSAKVRGGAQDSAPPALDRKRIMLGEQPISWSDWVKAWTTDTPSRLVTGASILATDTLDNRSSPR